MSERPLFDPSRIRVPESERDPLRAAPLTPRQVNEMVRGALARHVPSTLRVLGEIGDLSRPASGHLYFSLKDDDSELRCVMWRSSAARLRFQPTPGLEVIAAGGLEVYAPRGTYQLVVRSLEPRGVGALELAFRQLREKLEREGLFDPRRKRPLPRVPRRVAVVTSPSGAALRDILKTLSRRFPLLDILIFPTRVQGDGAAQEIADAIALLNRYSAEIDEIDIAIVGRGGGSLEDLWAFNEEAVARAIAASRVPVVSAVGHETDVSICDLVADVRAATPTAAAELVTPVLGDLLDALAQQSARAARLVTHAVQLQTSRLAALLSSQGLARPTARLREHGQLVDELCLRLAHASAGQRAAAAARLSQRELSVLRFGAGAEFARAGQRVQLAEFRLRHESERLLARRRQALEALATRLERGLPRQLVARQAEHVRQAAARLTAAVRRIAAHARDRLDVRLAAVAACDPRAVLRRGFSITREARTRRVLRSIADIRAGLRTITELSDGTFRGTADDPRQPGLFDDEPT